MDFERVLNRFGVSKGRVGAAYDAVLSYLKSLERYVSSDVAQRKLRDMCPSFDSLSDEDKEAVLTAFALSLFGMCNRNAIDLPECDEVRKVTQWFYSQLMALAMAKQYGVRSSRKLKGAINRLLSYADKVCGKEKKGLLAKIRGLFST